MKYRFSTIYLDHALPFVFLLSLLPQRSARMSLHPFYLKVVNVVVMIVVAVVRGSVIFAIACLGREVVGAFWESRQNSISIDCKDLMRRVALSRDDLLSPKKPGTLRIVSFGYLVRYGSFFSCVCKTYRRTKHISRCEQMKCPGEYTLWVPWPDVHV